MSCDGERSRRSCCEVQRMTRILIFTSPAWLSFAMAGLGVSDAV